MDPFITPAHHAALATGRAQDHSARIVIGLERRNVPACIDELRERPRFRQGERIFVRAKLEIRRLPVPRPVAVHVVSTDGVFVHRAVAVVIQPFGAEQRVFARLIDGSLDHQELRKLGMRLPASVRIFDAHRGDGAVIVQIVHVILIGYTVAIVVDGLHAGARAVGRLGAVEPTIAAIGIDGGDQVEHAAVEQLGHLVEAAVLMTEIPRGVGDGFAALDFIAMNVAIDVHARLPLGVALFAGDFEAPHVAAFH